MAKNCQFFIFLFVPSPRINKKTQHTYDLRDGFYNREIFHTLTSCDAFQLQQIQANIISQGTTPATFQAQEEGTFQMVLHPEIEHETPES